MKPSVEERSVSERKTDDKEETVLRRGKRVRDGDVEEQRGKGSK